MKTNIQKYPAYKDSGVEWLGEIPNHWEVKKVTHVFNKIGSGTTPTAGALKYYDNGQINWLQTGDLNDGLIDDTNKKITKKAITDFSTLKQYPKESIVIAMYGATIGKLGYLNIETTTNQACCVLGNPNTFSSKYGFYSFMNAKTSIISMSYGGGQPNISQDLVKSLRLSVPPLPEQTAIAAFLDRKTALIDQAIAIKKKQIELLKERRQILIHNAVTRGLNPNVKLKDSGVEWIGEIPEEWEVMRLKYLIDEYNVRSTNGNEELLSLSKYYGVVPKSSLEERAGQAESLVGYKKLNTEDLVINKMQAVNGLMAVSKISGITSPDYSIYRTKNKSILNIDYLGMLVLQPNYLAEFKRRVTGVMEGFIRLYTDDLYDVYSCLPPIQEQNEIMKFIENITQKIATAISLKEQEIEKLKEYKATLINSAVTGKIKVS